MDLMAKGVTEMVVTENGRNLGHDPHRRADGQTDQPARLMVLAPKNFKQNSCQIPYSRNLARPVPRAADKC